MALSTERDVDFATARLHARHSAMIEGARLDAMCRVRTVPELARRLWPDAPANMSSGDLQRRAMADFAAEIDELSLAVPTGVRAFFEKIKDGLLNKPHKSLAEDTRKASQYYMGLIESAKACVSPYDKAAMSIAVQEASIFLCMLALRLAFNYSMKPSEVRGYYFDGTALSFESFDRVLACGDLAEAIGICSKAIAGGLYCESISGLEAAARDRYLALARRIWMADTAGAGAIIGYVGLRRIEVSNIVMLSEGLRLGVESGRLRSYLIPRSGKREVHHV